MNKKSEFQIPKAIAPTQHNVDKVIVKDAWIEGLIGALDAIANSEGSTK